MYCSNLYKVLQISSPGVGTFFHLTKYHVQKKEKLVVLAIVLAKYYLSK